MCLHQNLEEESQGLESSQDHVIKESIACRSEPADSNAKTGIGFLQIAPADNDKGYVRRQDETCWTLQKGKDLSPSYLKLGMFSLRSKFMMSHA